MTRNNFSTISTKLEDREYQSIAAKVKTSFWNNYNSALSLKENFYIWAVDVQKRPQYEVGKIFNVKRSQASIDYLKAKAKQGGQS